MPSISALLKKKIAAEGLSLAKAATAIGVSVPSVRSGLIGKAVPNARSIGKYAKFLGLSLEQALALAGSRKGKGKGGRKAGAKTKGKARRGRPPGTGKGKARRGRPPGKAKAKGRRGRPPGAGANKAVGAAVARVTSALRRAEKHLVKLVKSIGK